MGAQTTLLRGMYFQFHYGTIKSVYTVVLMNLAPAFQFHYGTIKRARAGSVRTALRSFNSTMVRLKGCPDTAFVVHTELSIPLWYD